MRKLFSFLLAFTFIAGLFPVTAAASNFGGTNQQSFSIYSDPCPNEVIAFAKNNFSSLMSESIINGTIDVDMDEFTSISLGNPFTITSPSADTNVYYFPIISQNSILGTLRIYHDGDDYAGIMSQYLSDELNSLIGKTSALSPAHLIFDNNNLVLEQHGIRQLLLASPTGDLPNNIDVLSDKLIVTPFSTELSTITSSSLISSYDISKYLNLNIIEIQEDDEWCFAYCAAAIIRYVNDYDDDPTAESIMKLALGRNPTKSDSLNAIDVIKVAAMYDLYPSYSATAKTQDAVNQLDHNVPVFLRCSRPISSTKSTEKAYHAVVLRGYNLSSADTYSIWNPWNDYYETMTSSLKYVTGDRTYTWVGTILGWDSQLP